VEAAWRIAQPILDYWKLAPADDFPNYTRNSWGPKSAFELLEKDGRRWYEVVTPEVLEQSPMFKGAELLLLNAVILALQPVTFEQEELIVNQGDVANEMYFICRGEVEIIDHHGHVIEQLGDGDFFGEIGILMATTRTASVRAKTPCDLFMLTRKDFGRILQDYPQFADNMMRVAKERYDLIVSEEQLFTNN
jgi:glucose-6-phosphate 1-dehydrogenase